MKKYLRVPIVVLALSVAVACSSSEDEGGGGGPSGAVGQQMSELGDLGSQFIEANQETYDTLGQATDLIGDAVAGAVTTQSITSKQTAGCLPEELAGQTLLVDVQSDTFEGTDPRGEPDEVIFVLLSDPETEVGYASLTCQGTPPGPINVNVVVSLADDTEVMNLSASQISVMPPSGFSATLGGTLSSSDGDTIQFGQFGFQGGSSVFIDQTSSSASTAFLVGDGLTASVSQGVFGDVSFAEETIRINIEGASNFDPMATCPNSFLYEGTMTGVPGAVSGGAVFCAQPPLADGFNYFVNCFDGSIEDMVVSVAEARCLPTELFFGDPTNVGSAVLQDIQSGTTALLGMHNTIIATARAGGEVALKLFEAAQQQQQQQ